MKKIFSDKTVQLLVLLVVAAAISVFLYVAKTKEYSNWIPVNAVITDWKTGRDVSHILYFKYSLGETEYNGQDSFSGNFPKNKVGDTVTAWYDPDNVSRAMISAAKPDAGLWTYVPFFFALPLSLYIIFGGNKRKSKALI